MTLVDGLETVAWVKICNNFADFEVEKFDLFEVHKRFEIERGRETLVCLVTEASFERLASFEVEKSLASFVAFG